MALKTGSTSAGNLRTVVYNADQIQWLGLGTYHLCAYGMGGDSSWAPTGIALVVQERVMRLGVNLIEPNGGVRVTAPRHTGNVFEAQGEGLSDARVSLIPHDADCFSPIDNPSDAGASMRTVSGDMEVVSRNVRSAGALGVMDAGLYQLCLRQNSSGWVGLTTGIAVRIQVRVRSH